VRQPKGGCRLRRLRPTAEVGLQHLGPVGGQGEGVARLRGLQGQVPTQEQVPPTSMRSGLAQVPVLEPLELRQNCNSG